MSNKTSNYSPLIRAIKFVIKNPDFMEKEFEPELKKLEKQDPEMVKKLKELNKEEARSKTQ